MPPATKPKPTPAKAKTPPDAPPIAATELTGIPEIDKVIHELRRPFTPEAVKWKVQANPKSMDKSALVVGFIDARLATERLNAVCPGMWSSQYHPLPHAGSVEQRGEGVLCTITMRAHAPDGEWLLLERSDVGVFPAGTPEIRVKGGYSDALKRAAVQWGVGVSIYAVPQQWMGRAEGLNYFERNDKKIQAYMTPKAEAELRKRYAAWLQAHGITYFGEPLSHGESEREQGDVEAGDLQATGAAPANGVEEEGDAPPAPDRDPKVVEQLTKARQALAAAKVDPKAVKNHLTAEYRVSAVMDIPDEQVPAFLKWVVAQVKQPDAEAAS